MFYLAIFFLFPIVTPQSHPGLPLTLLIPREWHTPPLTTPPGSKVAQIKLSPESGHSSVNVSYGLEPSYHDDVSSYFRVEEGGGVFVAKDLTDWKKPFGFLQITANAPSIPTSKVEVRINFANSGTSRRPIWGGPTPSPATIVTFSTTPTPIGIAPSSTVSNLTKPTTKPTTTTTLPPSTTITPVSSPSSSTQIILTVTIVTLVLLVLVAIFLFLYRRRSHKKPHLTKEKPPPTNGTRALSNRYEEGFPPGEESTPEDKWAVPRHKLKILEILGEGCFGQVWRADYNGTTVAVKTLKESASERDKLDLLSELGVLQTLEPHPNVVQLIGSCVDGSLPPYIILEYVHLGKLQSYLRSARVPDTNYSNLHSDSTLTSKDLTSFSLQVARGMDYLSRKGIIHRDLAARNVLLTAERSCKVCDFGFSREGVIYERKSGEGRLPIRWMAPESLYDSIFTTKSDVWSFGVLMWEIVTLGSTPYPGMNPGVVMKTVRGGGRLEKPLHCKRELYNIMFYCWADKPEDRPSFSDLGRFLSSLIEQDEDYIQMELFPEHDYYNMDVGEEEEKV